MRFILKMHILIRRRLANYTIPKHAFTIAREHSLELAEISNGQSVLEVSVGTGLAFYEIVKNNPGGVNIGIDLLDGMLEKAKKGYPS